MKKRTLFGLEFIDGSLEETFNYVEESLKHGHRLVIATPNPEMIVETRSSSDFFSILKSADMNLPDGFGLILASRILGDRINNRTTGVDFVEYFLQHDSMHKVFLLGGFTGSAAAVVQKFQSALIVGIYDGEIDERSRSSVISKIEESGAEILFVALGSPKQEIWIRDNNSCFSNVRLFMGVGGSLDFLAGKQRRAPRVLRNIGMEWFWRLIKEPKRIRRIFNAVFVFSWIVLKEKF